jgi:hypothetical protein
VRGLRGKRTRSAEKIRSAALAICRKRGGATTRARRRKAGRTGQGEGVRRERSRLIRCGALHTNHRGDVDGLPAMEPGGVNLSPQETIVVTTALIGAMGNGYLFVAAVHDGHRGLYHAAAVAFFIFSLVAGVFFWRAM